MCRISIHVPREGDDGTRPSLSRTWSYFYPRPPRGGRRSRRRRCGISGRNFYPRPPRGGRLDECVRIAQQKAFLSTSPARGTTGKMVVSETGRVFLSTSPARGTTSPLHSAANPRPYFYPRPPRGGRPWRGPTPTRTCHFYPRPPRGGRPTAPTAWLLSATISIHVPREGDDSKCDGKYIAFSCNICHNKIQRTKTRCIFVQNATVSAAYLHKYPKNDNRPPVRTVRCFSAHCRLAPAPCRPQRAFLHRCLYTSKISSCAHCGARPTCSTLVLYWLPSR